MVTCFTFTLGKSDATGVILLEGFVYVDSNKTMGQSIGRGKGAEVPPCIKISYSAYLPTKELHLCVTVGYSSLY